MPIYRPGFLAVADRLGGVDVVGYPQEDETYFTFDDGRQYSFQLSDKGLFVYSKGANNPLFIGTPQSRIARPGGGNIQANWDYPGLVAGNLYAHPRGVIIHASRSGRAQDFGAEFWGTSRYAVGNPAGVGWHATVGPHLVSIHMQPHQFGWNARGCSPYYIAVEMAQGVASQTVGDEHLNALAWYINNVVRQVYPNLPMHFPSHAELDGTAEYGGAFDGKTDLYPRGDWRMDDFRSRLLQRL